MKLMQNSGVPIYQQIADSFKTDILAGKWQTACAFQRNIRFAFRYASKEGFWVFSSLLKGQLK